jgi:LacI family transcriptional regulator
MTQKILNRAPAIPARWQRVAVAIPTFAAFQRQMIYGIINFAQANAPDWVFEFRKQVEPPLAVLHRAKHCDAVLAYIDGNSPGVRAALRRIRMPTVLIESWGADMLPVVRGDNRAIGRLAFDHLRSKGFRAYAYVGTMAFIVFRERREAFAEAVREARLELIEAPALGNSVDADDSTVRSWIAKAPKPLGLFCGNVEAARRVAALCREVNALVPEEVAILGVDNERLESELSWPPLSTIDHGMDRAGYRAAELLQSLMQGQPPPSAPILIPPTGVIERQSTDTLAVHDPEVRSAITLIREHAHKGLTVAQLLQILPVTRRKLEIAFRRHVGRSIHDELIRVRMERTKLLLSTTDMPMSEVAWACGIQNASRLSESFFKVVGMTPRAYRREFRKGLG